MTGKTYLATITINSVTAKASANAINPHCARADILRRLRSFSEFQGMDFPEEHDLLADIAEEEYGDGWDSLSSREQDNCEEDLQHYFEQIMDEHGFDVKIEIVEAAQ